MSESTTAQSLPPTIQPPPDFPVTWPDPDDARLFWTRDRMHAPGQTSPLEFSLDRYSAAGWQTGFAYMGVPVHSRSRLINTYVYHADEPPPPPGDGVQMEASMAQVKEKMNQKMGRLQELWETEWLPEIQAHLAFWDGFDLDHASMPELIQHLDDTCDHYYRLWDLHFRIVLPVMFPISLFADLYQDLFGSDNPFGAYALLEGLPNLTVAIGHALWRLSRRALADPAVAAMIARSEPANVRTALQQSETGRAFLNELDAFLAQYGRRGEMWGIAYPTWQEDPTPIIRTLRDYIAQPDRDLEHDLAAAAARREERVAQVRRQLQGYPEPVVGQFEFLLKAAQMGTILSEDHGYWIDFVGGAAVRRVFLEFGRRLADEGVIEQRDDLFYLTLDELRQTAATVPMPDQHARVATRKAEAAHYAAVNPPAALGTPPPDAPPSDDPIARGMLRFWGGPPPAQDTPGLLRGNPGSAGTVRGPVKVVHNLGDAGKLQPGDVLVAITTAPPWTPLFATAAAVVTDTGGVLSHCAVVAREYGIPAVVGTGTGTTMLHDGELVEVDGTLGVVRLLDGAA